METGVFAPGESSSQAKLREKEIFRITLWGAFGNILLSIFKIFAGTVGRSHAVVADGVHSFSDLATDLAILIGSRYWSRPPDLSHPHGHRRIETLVSLVIGFVLAGVAVGIGWSSIDSLRDGNLVVPGKIALLAALTSIVVKEGLFRWTVSVGRRVKSQAVEANAWHHRSDAFSSIPAAAAVAGAALSPKFAFLDPVGGILVSLFILYASGKIMWPVLRELVDTGAPEGMIERIGAIVLMVEGVHGVHRIRTRYLGSRLAVDLHLMLDDELPLVEAHRIGDEVADRLKQQEPDIVDVITHLDPRHSHDDNESVAW